VRVSQQVLQSSSGGSGTAQETRVIDASTGNGSH
jgi:hypothetical protein